jgi:hypothetical protein
MNNNFKQLLERFSEQWENVTVSTTLEDVEKNFSALEETRDDILTWVFDNIQDEEEQGTYFSSFGSVESHLAESYGGIPVFDQEFDIYESFDEYEAYYQRYGCLVPEFVISWDSDRILWSDDLNIDFIKRPDVLMSSDSD